MQILEIYKDIMHKDKREASLIWKILRCGGVKDPSGAHMQLGKLVLLFVAEREHTPRGLCDVSVRGC